MAKNNGPRCGVHPGAAAGWSCPACERALCLACAVRRRAGQGSVVLCRGCGGPAEPVLVPRASEPFFARIFEAFGYPFSGRGIAMLVGLGVLLYLARGMRAGGFATALLYAYLFLVIRTTARGDDDVPDLESFVPWELAGTMLKVIAALATAAIPFFVYALIARPPEELGFFESLAWYVTQPTAWVTLAVGIVWTPMAVVLAATHSPLSTILHPLVSARAVWRLGTDYALATVAFWGLFLLSLHASSMGEALPEVVSIPIVAGIAGSIGSLYLPLVGARVLGSLLYVRGADVGYGQADALVPALGEAMPVFEEPPPTPPVAADAPPVPLALIRTERLAAAPASLEVVERRSHDPLELDLPSHDPGAGPHPPFDTFLPTPPHASAPTRGGATVTEDLMPEDAFELGLADPPKGRE